MTRSAIDKVVAQLAPATTKKKPVKPAAPAVKVQPVGFTAAGIAITAAGDAGQRLAGSTAAVPVDESRLDVQLPSPSGPLTVDTQAELREAAAKGSKFRPGRDAGAIGPVRKEIRRLLKHHSNASPGDLWDMLKGSPPDGWEFFDLTVRGKRHRYIEIVGEPGNTTLKTFQNMVGQERKLIS